MLERSRLRRAAPRRGDGDEALDAREDLGTEDALHAVEQLQVAERVRREHHLKGCNVRGYAAIPGVGIARVMPTRQCRQ